MKLPSHCIRPASRGFSLIELMVVLGIALILLGIGIPAMGSLIRSQKLTASANEFLSAIYLTRSEAIQRGVRVDLMAAGGDWRDGWVVFVDQNDNRQHDGADHVIYRQGPLPAGMVVTSQLKDNNVQYLSYGATGRPRTHAGWQQPQFGTFRFRLDEQKRNIIINMLGRPRVCTPPPEEEQC